MPLPPAYHPVYNLHVRLPEPSLHANPLIQTPPIPHLEGLHLIQWVMSDAGQLSSTVRGDSQRFALKDHDSGKLIPHLPLPPMLGPFLLDTLQGSKYQVLFHQPNVLLDGKPVGVFQWGIAPPWRCIELKLPLPKFLARAGRASAARNKASRLLNAGERIDKASEAQARAAAAWTRAESLKRGAAAIEQLEAAHREVSAAVDEMNDAMNQGERREAWLRAEERQQRAREAEVAALRRKRELDRLRRRSRASEGRASGSRASGSREGGEAWAQEAREQEQLARQHRDAARKERANLRQAEEALARARGNEKGNPMQQATGESNAGLIAPSLLAHLPFPATVEIQVSWSQIGKTWVATLVGVAAEALKYYVGFVFEGVLAPGSGQITGHLLDFVKSGINDTLIDGGAKYLVEDSWPFKVNKKLGPVTVSATCEPDPSTGARKWKATIDVKSKPPSLPAVNTKASIEGHGGAPEKASVEVAGRPVAEHTFSKPLVDYSHGVPAVN